MLQFGQELEDKMAQKQWAIECCNPFGKANHSHIRKNLQPVLPWMCEKLPSLSLEAKVCDACRKKLSQVPIAETESADLFESSEEDIASSTHPAEETFCQLESLEPINQCLSAIGETPVVKKKLQHTKYQREKNEEDYDSCEEYDSTCKGTQCH